MITHPTRRALLLPALLLCVAACDDRSVLSPREVEAQERSYAMDEHALLRRIVAKLDSFEVRAEREKVLIHARLDSLRSTALLMIAMAPPGNGNGPDTTGNINQQVSLILAKTDSISRRALSIYSKSDSIMALTDFVAKDVAEAFQGFEVCGSVKIGGEAELKSTTEGEGKAKGTVGVAPAETGAAAAVEVKSRLGIEFAGVGGVEIGGEGCIDLTKVGTVIPGRSGAAALNYATQASGTQLQATLQQLATQLSLNESNVDNAVRAGTSIVQSGDFGQLAALTSALPVPAVFSNPMGTMKSKLASFDPIALLCSGGFGGRIGTAVNNGCGFINANNLPDLGAFLSLGNNFTTLKSNFTGLCSRFNSVVDTEITITLPVNLGTINQPLFPASWNVPCS